MRQPLPIPAPEPLSPARAGALQRILAALPEHRITGGREAAVLVPLYEHDGEVHVVLTRRPEWMPTHAGQISFPGGSRERRDRDLLATAIREADEEIGLAKEAVTSLGLLGTLPTYATEFVVSAYVASITRPEEWRPSADEIDEIIELPLPALAEARTNEIRERDGYRWAMPVFEVDGHRVWGFTAFILAKLLDVAAPELLNGPVPAMRISEEEADRIIQELHDSEETFDWTGIYWRRGEDLVLGPYRGAHPAGHELIHIPDGVCGAVAKSGETEVVPDVRARPGHIACEISTRSEVVTPIYLMGEVVGVLDVDSNTPDAFDADRVARIEAFAARLGAVAERAT